MRPSVGAVPVRSSTEVRAKTPAMPVATPTRAVTSGSPAASREPNVTASTSSATRTPRPSALEVCDCAWTASPPYSTWRPAASAASPELSRADWSAAVIWSAPTV